MCTILVTTPVSQAFSQRIQHFPKWNSNPYFCHSNVSFITMKPFSLIKYRYPCECVCKCLCELTADYCTCLLGISVKLFMQVCKLLCHFHWICPVHVNNYKGNLMPRFRPFWGEHNNHYTTMAPWCYHSIHTCTRWDDRMSWASISRFACHFLARRLVLLGQGNNMLVQCQDNVTE